MRLAALLLGLAAVASAVPAGAPGVGPAPLELANHNCGGTAPVTGSCAVDLVAAPGAGYRLYVNPGTGFTGTITAALVDQDGRARTVACAFQAFVGGVSPAPACSAGGSHDLAAGPLRLEGRADGAEGLPSVGYWEVHVDVS